MDATKDLFGANDNKPTMEDFWAGLDIDKLPKTGTEANRLGIKFFFTGEPCVQGHTTPRYAAGGRCVACTRITSAKAYDGEYKGNASAARANIKRAIASMTMARTYVPSKPCMHGHMMRYVSSGNCVECHEASVLRRREKAKEMRLISLYSLTFEDRDRMAEAQGFKCPICWEPFGDARAMHVDHCHESGAVRGLLCSLCNQAIGLLRETPEIIRRAANYVEAHQKVAA